MHSCALQHKYKNWLWWWISCVSEQLTISTRVSQPCHLSRLGASDPAAVKVTASWSETSHVAPVNTNPLMTSGTKAACLKEESLCRCGKNVHGKGGSSHSNREGSSGSIHKTAQELLLLSLPDSEGLLYKLQRKSWLSYK